MTLEDIYHQIEQRMTELHKTTRDVETESKIGIGVLHRWFTGKRIPGVETLNRVLKVLGLRLEVHEIRHNKVM